MSILVAALQRVVAEAKKLTLYRGVQDIYPSQVTHTYEGDGVFGPGTYFAMYYEDAEGYAQGHSNGFELFGLVLEYEQAASRAYRASSNSCFSSSSVFIF